MLMPAHDWTRVFPGTFHDFHSAWIIHLKETLNAGVLPDEFFALAEQHSGDAVPDVLTLSRFPRRNGGVTTSGGLLVAETPPKVSLCVEADEDVVYRTLRRTIAIRHRTGRELVAMVEIVSPSNKASQPALDQFVDKSASAIRQGIHLLVIDLVPPSPRDPQGIHGEIWKHVGGDFRAPPARPLTLVAYEAAQLPKAFVEPISVGSELPPMPLFLDIGRYVNTPLEATYMAAYQGMPRVLKDVLEGAAPPEWESAEP
jgi:hypothetical protein